MWNQIYVLIRFKGRNNGTVGKKGTNGRSCHAVKKLSYCTYQSSA